MKLLVIAIFAASFTFSTALFAHGSGYQQSHNQLHNSYAKHQWATHKRYGKNHWAKRHKHHRFYHHTPRYGHYTPYKAHTKRYRHHYGYIKPRHRHYR